MSRGETVLGGEAGCKVGINKREFRFLFVFAGPGFVWFASLDFSFAAGFFLFVFMLLLRF